MLAMTKEYFLNAGESLRGRIKDGEKYLEAHATKRMRAYHPKDMCRTYL